MHLGPATDWHVYEGSDHTLEVTIPSGPDVPAAADVTSAVIYISGVAELAATASDGDDGLVLTAALAGTTTDGERGKHAWEAVVEADGVRQTVARGGFEISASLVAVA